MKKEKGLLSNCDGLEVDDIMIMIEKSFDIKFVEEETLKIKTYGDLENYIFDKIKGEPANDCTSQQAFYQLRKILSEEFNIPFENIRLDTKLKDIFPDKNRKENVLKLEQSLKIKNELLTLNGIQFLMLACIFISAFILIFINSFYGISLFVIGIIISEMTKSNTFAHKDIRELSNFLKSENYINSRRNSETYNPKEVREIIKEYFSEYLGIEKYRLIPNAIL